MNLVSSFPPLAAPDARVLIVGSMPGVRSLAAGEYYAHRQNAFWRILAELLDFDADTPYASRVAALKRGRVAVWDVIASCERQGSMDADIRAPTANDFAGFFARHGAVGHVFCNGTTAFRLWQRCVAPTVSEALTVARLPSTSPAYAAMSFADKLNAWSAVGAVLELGKG
ncbi:MAG: DNA-deoxyinosine glycosylase [Pseudomonadota bacterium]